MENLLVLFKKKATPALLCLPLIVSSAFPAPECNQSSHVKYSNMSLYSSKLNNSIVFEDGSPVVSIPQGSYVQPTRAPRVRDGVTEGLPQDFSVIATAPGQLLALNIVRKINIFLILYWGLTDQHHNGTEPIQQPMRGSMGCNMASPSCGRKLEHLGHNEWRTSAWIEKWVKECWLKKWVYCVLVPCKPISWYIDC